MQFKPNPEQQVALEHLYDPKNEEGEKWDPNDPPTIELIEVEDGRVELNIEGAYLHLDGEWATFPEGHGNGS